MEEELQLLDDLSKRILALLYQVPEGLSFSDIVRHTGRPRETINRRLKLLVELGLVEKIKRKRGLPSTYKLSKDLKEHIIKLLDIELTVELLALDFARGFVDLASLDYMDEAYSLLCTTSFILAAHYSSSLALYLEFFTNYGYKSLEEGLSMKEMENRLMNLGLFVHRFRLDFPRNLISISVGGALRLLEKKAKISLDIKRLEKSCLDLGTAENKTIKGLEILASKGYDYAPRLLEIVQMYKKHAEETTMFLLIKEKYKNEVRIFRDNLI